MIFSFYGHDFLCLSAMKDDELLYINVDNCWNLLCAGIMDFYMHWCYLTSHFLMYSRIWDETWLAGFFYKPCNYELFVKQSLNMEMAIVMARVRHMQ